jgi:hypothetical protein
MPGRGLFILERAVDDAGFFPNPDLRSVTSKVLVGEPVRGGEFARDDRSERRVNEKELSRLLCFGMSTAGVATSAGPSTPVLTMLVVVGPVTLGVLSWF